LLDGGDSLLDGLAVGISEAGVEVLIWHGRWPDDSESTLLAFPLGEVKSNCLPPDLVVQCKILSL
jgi:hypothetical protein